MSRISFKKIKNYFIREEIVTRIRYVLRGRVCAICLLKTINSKLLRSTVYFKINRFVYVYTTRGELLRAVCHKFFGSGIFIRSLVETAIRQPQKATAKTRKEKDR